MIPTEVDVLLDSARIMAALQSANAGSNIDVNLSIKPGSPTTGHIMSGDARAPSNTVLLNAVIASLRPPTRESPLAFRIRLKRGKNTEIKLDRSVLCAPIRDGQSADDKKAETHMVAVGSNGSGPRVASSAVRTGTTTARVRIDNTGKV